MYTCSYSIVYVVENGSAESKRVQTEKQPFNSEKSSSLAEQVSFSKNRKHLTYYYANTFLLLQRTIVKKKILNLHKLYSIFKFRARKWANCFGPSLFLF